MDAVACHLSYPASMRAYVFCRERKSIEDVSNPDSTIASVPVDERVIRGGHTLLVTTQDPFTRGSENE